MHVKYIESKSKSKKWINERRHWVTSYCQNEHWKYENYPFFFEIRKCKSKEKQMMLWKKRFQKLSQNVKRFLWILKNSIKEFSYLLSFQRNDKYKFSSGYENMNSKQDSTETKLEDNLLKKQVSFNDFKNRKRKLFPNNIISSNRSAFYSLN